METDTRSAFRILVEYLQRDMNELGKKAASTLEHGRFQEAEEILKRGKELEQISDLLKFALTRWDRLYTKSASSKPTQFHNTPDFDLNTEHIQTLYERYRNSPDEQADLDRRQRNYERIPALLDNLITAPGRDSFFTVYETLTGKSGHKSLWHSGGLFRSKNLVADQYKEVQDLVQLIRTSPEAPAMDLFSRGMSKAQQIHGLGINIFTEIMHSYYPDRCPIVNKNSLTSLTYLTAAKFPEKQLFRSSHYGIFIEGARKLCELFKLPDFGHLDHFFNFVFWHYAKDGNSS